MFGGQWREADENCICIDIPDENIDIEGGYANVIYHTDSHEMILYS